MEEMEWLVIDSSNGTTHHFSNAFIELCASGNSPILDSNKLHTQLQLLPDLLQATNEQSAQSIRIKKVTSVGTVADIMNTSLVNKDMLSDVDTLLKLYYTIPMTTATSKRSFSTEIEELPQEYYDTKQTQSYYVTACAQRAN